MAAVRSAALVTLLSPTLVIRSPACSPAWAAGCPCSTPTMRAPPPFSGSVRRTPRKAWVTEPWSMSCWAMSLAESMGMANPTPMLPPWPLVFWASEAMAVLMPTTSPWVLTRAPPELPGLIAASVWMASMTTACEAPELPPNGLWSSAPSVTERPRALTMPDETEPSRPSGLPMASTVSPTCRLPLLPNLAGLSPDTFLAWMTARSVAGSRPRMSASAGVPSEKVTFREPPSATDATTWLLVRIWPSALMMMPEPLPETWPASKLMDTTLGRTAAAASDSGSSGALFDDELDAGALRLEAPGVVVVLLLSSRFSAIRAPPVADTSMRPAAARTATARRPLPGGGGGTGDAVGGSVGGWGCPGAWGGTGCAEAGAPGAGAPGGTGGVGGAVWGPP